jgi:hypothetical protein
MNKLVGKVITNAAGDKAISFTDEDWAALPVGANIFAEAPCGPRKRFTSIRAVRTAARRLGRNYEECDQCYGWHLCKR